MLLTVFKERLPLHIFLTLLPVASYISELYSYTLVIKDETDECNTGIRNAIIVNCCFVSLCLLTTALQLYNLVKNGRMKSHIFSWGIILKIFHALIVIIEILGSDWEQCPKINKVDAYSLIVRHAIICIMFFMQSTRVTEIDRPVLDIPFKEHCFYEDPDKDARVANEEKCTICKKQYTNHDKIKKLFCKHIFHKRCINNKFVKSASTKCPVCKKDQLSMHKKMQPSYPGGDVRVTGSPSNKDTIVDVKPDMAVPIKTSKDSLTITPANVTEMVIPVVKVV